LFTILPFIEYEYGIWHPIGGCHALMQALAKLAVELGVEISTDAPVDAIEFDGSRGRGVVVRGERHATDHVVVNADAAWAMKKFIPESLRKGWRPVGGSYDDATLDDKKYSCSTFMLYLGVEGEVDLPHHTICVSSRYEDNLDEITNKGTLSEDPSVYVCNPSRLDPTLAPEGKSSLYVLVPCPNLKQSAAAKAQGKPHADWTRDAGELRRRTFQQLDRLLGLRDLEKRVLTERVYTPLDWQGMNINFGATFNLAHNLGQMLHRRPQNKLPFTDNVYLVGGGTHPGSGLPTIFLSSQISVRMLCDRVGVPYAGNTERVREIARGRGLAQMAPA
jgi:phytoene desaturase